MSKELIQTFRNAKGMAHPHAFIAVAEFTNWREEQMSWMKTVCIGSWSFVPKAVMKGPDALELLEKFSVNSLKKYDIGQAKHVINCNKDGKVITEGMVMRVGEEEFYLYSTPAVWFEYQASLAEYKDNVTVQMENQLDTSIYQVAGPNAIYLLEEVANESLRDIKFMRFRNIIINGRDVMAINGLTMAGETGFELQFPHTYHDDVYNTILEVGKKYGLRELGHKNHQINHLLACFPTVYYHYFPALFGDEEADFMRYILSSPSAYLSKWKLRWKILGSFEGNDISDYYRSPVEMGWIKHINFDHDFLGRKALEAEVAHPKRKVVTLEFNSEDLVDIYASNFKQGEPREFMDIPQQYQFSTRVDAVSKDGKLIGVSTGPGYSYYFRKMLAISYIDVNYTKPGTNVEVLWGSPGTRQKIIRATVAPAPYKKDTRKIDLTTLPEKLVLNK